MPFARQLSREFVTALNDLYRRSGGSWWKSLVDDGDIFIAIRKEALNAYSQGGSIGRVAFKNGQVSLQTHIEYLTLQATEITYVDLTQPRDLSRSVAWNTDLYVQNLVQIKGRPRRFSGDERAGENEIACSQGRVLDIEAAFSTDEELSTEDDENLEFAEKTGRENGRLDIVGLSPGAWLIFTEVKLYKNGDLRSRTVPDVCNQLAEYHKFLSNNKRQIEDAYCQLVNLYSDLDGRFFETHRPDRRDMSVDTVPRLLVIDCDTPQKKRFNDKHAPMIVEHCKGLIEGFTPQHVKAVGSPSSVTAAHLGLT